MGPQREYPTSGKAGSLLERGKAVSAAGEAAKPWRYSRDLFQAAILYVASKVLFQTSDDFKFQISDFKFQISDFRFE